MVINCGHRWAGSLQNSLCVCPGFVVLILNVFGCTLWIKISKIGCVAVQDLVFLSAGLAFHLRSMFSLRVAETGKISGSF